MCILGKFSGGKHSQCTFVCKKFIEMCPWDQYPWAIRGSKNGKREELSCDAAVTRASTISRGTQELVWPFWGAPFWRRCWAFIPLYLDLTLEVGGTQKRNSVLATWLSWADLGKVWQNPPHNEQFWPTGHLSLHWSGSVSLWRSNSTPETYYYVFKCCTTHCYRWHSLIRILRMYIVILLWELVLNSHGIFSHHSYLEYWRICQVIRSRHSAWTCCKSLSCFEPHSDGAIKCTSGLVSV